MQRLDVLSLIILVGDARQVEAAAAGGAGRVLNPVVVEGGGFGDGGQGARRAVSRSNRLLRALLFGSGEAK